MKIRPAGAEYIKADTSTDRWNNTKKLSGAFRYCANVPRRFNEMSKLGNFSSLREVIYWIVFHYQKLHKFLKEEA